MGEHAQEELDLFGLPLRPKRSAAKTPSGGIERRALTGALKVDPAIAAVVDDLLMQRGEVSVAECLIRLGVMDQEPPLPAPASGFGLEHVPAAAVVIAQIQAYGRAQGLVPPPSMSDRGVPVQAGVAFGSSGPGLLVAPPDSDQTDLFRDGAVTVAIHGLHRALGTHQIDDARCFLGRLGELEGSDQGDYANLISAAAAPPRDPAARLRQMQTQIVPLAQRRLRNRAESYLAPLWRDLARQLAGYRFDPSDPNLHPSYALGEARAWAEAAAIILQDPQGSVQPVLMVRLAEAQCRSGHPEEGRRSWVQLCWQHPKVAEVAIPQNLGDASLRRFWDAFSGADLGFLTENFPAWLLLADPRQRHWCPAEPGAAEENPRIYAAVHALLASGGALPERKQLQRLHPDLLKAYLATLGA